MASDNEEYTTISDYQTHVASSDATPSTKINGLYNHLHTHHINSNNQLPNGMVVGYSKFYRQLELDKIDSSYSSGLRTTIASNSLKPIPNNLILLDTSSSNFENWKDQYQDRIDILSTVNSAYKNISSSFITDTNIQYNTYDFSSILKAWCKEDSTNNFGNSSALVTDVLSCTLNGAIINTIFSDLTIQTDVHSDTGITTSANIYGISPSLYLNSDYPNSSYISSLHMKLNIPNLFKAILCSTDTLALDTNDRKNIFNYIKNTSKVELNYYDYKTDNTLTSTTYLSATNNLTWDINFDNKYQPNTKLFNYIKIYLNVIPSIDTNHNNTITLKPLNIYLELANPNYNKSYLNLNGLTINETITFDGKVTNIQDELLKNLSYYKYYTDTVLAICIDNTLENTQLNSVPIETVITPTEFNDKTDRKMYYRLAGIHMGDTTILTKKHVVDIYDQDLLYKAVNASKNTNLINTVINVNYTNTDNQYICYSKNTDNENNLFYNEYPNISVGIYYGNKISDGTIEFTNQLNKDLKVYKLINNNLLVDSFTLSSDIQQLINVNKPLYELYNFETKRLTGIQLYPVNIHTSTLMYNNDNIASTLPYTVNLDLLKTYLFYKTCAKTIENVLDNVHYCSNVIPSSNDNALYNSWFGVDDSYKYIFNGIDDDILRYTRGAMYPLMVADTDPASIDFSRLAKNKYLKGIINTNNTTFDISKANSDSENPLSSVSIYPNSGTNETSLSSLSVIENYKTYATFSNSLYLKPVIPYYYHIKSQYDMKLYNKINKFLTPATNIPYICYDLTNYLTESDFPPTVFSDLTTPALQRNRRFLLDRFFNMYYEISGTATNQTPHNAAYRVPSYYFGSHNYNTYKTTSDNINFIYDFNTTFNNNTSTYLGKNLVDVPIYRIYNLNDLNNGIRKDKTYKVQDYAEIPTAYIKADPGISPANIGGSEYVYLTDLHIPIILTFDAPNQFSGKLDKDIYFYNLTPFSESTKSLSAKISAGTTFTETSSLYTHIITNLKTLASAQGDKYATIKIIHHKTMIYSALSKENIYSLVPVATSTHVHKYFQVTNDNTSAMYVPLCEKILKILPKNTFGFCARNNKDNVPSAAPILLEYNSSVMPFDLTQWNIFFATYQSQINYVACKVNTIWNLILKNLNDENSLYSYNTLLSIPEFTTGQQNNELNAVSINKIDPSILTNLSSVYLNNFNGVTYAAGIPSADNIQEFSVQQNKVYTLFPDYGWGNEHYSIESLTKDYELYYNFQTAGIINY